jgi:hypothetical protein
MSNEILNIDETLEDIGEAVLTAITYKRSSVEHVEYIIQTIDSIIDNPTYLKQCEVHFKSEGSNYILFFLSNIIYNLKKQGELILTPEVLKWLGSVWKNFLKRNKSYQELFPHIDKHRILLKQYYPGNGVFINQIDNVNLVKEQYIDTIDEENNNLDTLEKFYHSIAELLTWMRPTFFFLLDFYYECKLNTGIDMKGSAEIEAKGLTGFGQFNYTYLDISLLATQCLGVLEASYLLLKKKKSSRRIFSIDGKQKFLTPSEIYTAYLDKFNQMKKELTSLNKE